MTAVRARTEDREIEDRETIEREPNGVSYLSYRPWKGDMIQGVTLRSLEGDLGKPFDMAGKPSLRPGLRSRDWGLFRGSIAGPEVVVAAMEQVHGRNVVAVDRDRLHEGDVKGGALYIHACDGMITNVPNLLLSVRVADCVPIFLRDRVVGAMGLLHAGWKGTAAGIVQVAIRRMNAEYGSEAPDIEIYMGPSIERACYPVSGDVYRRFGPWNENGPEPDGNWKVDLRGINRRQAVAEGIPEDRIFISHYCTACSKEMFYSHRASGGARGRMAAFLAIRKQFFS